MIQRFLKQLQWQKSLNITDYILVGDEKKILDISKNAGFEINENKIYNEPNNIKAVKKAVQLVKSNQSRYINEGFCEYRRFFTWSIRQG